MKTKAVHYNIYHSRPIFQFTHVYIVFLIFLTRCRMFYRSVIRHDTFLPTCQAKMGQNTCFRPSPSYNTSSFQRDLSHVEETDRFCFSLSAVESDPDAVPRSSDCYDFKPIECQLYKTCASLTDRENCPRTCRMCEDFA